MSEAKGMVVVGFTLYTDDKLWTLTAKHRKFFNELMRSGTTRLQGETFFLVEEVDEGGYIAGLCVVDTYGATVRIGEVDVYRQRLLKALSKSGIIIPATYGPDLYLAVTLPGQFDEEEDSEITTLEDHL